MIYYLDSIVIINIMKQKFTKFIRQNMSFIVLPQCLASLFQHNLVSIFNVKFFFLHHDTRLSHLQFILLWESCNDE